MYKMTNQNLIEGAHNDNYDIVVFITTPKLFPVVNKSDFASLLIAQYPMDNTNSLAAH